METQGTLVSTTLKVSLVTLGLVVGLVDVAAVDELRLGLLCVAVGGFLNFAFRAHPGVLCQRWRAHRRRGPYFLFAIYHGAGPYLWRLGAGLFLGSLARVL